jgi:hypothetical protein
MATITGAERYKLLYQEEQARRAKQAANRAALGKAPEVAKPMRDELGRAPTQAAKDAYQSDKEAANFAAKNASRASRGLDPKLSGDEKVARGNARAIAKGQAPKPYTTEAGKEAYNEAKNLATLEAMRPGTAAAKAATAANRAAQQEANYQTSLGRTYHRTRSAFKKGGSVTSAPKRAKSGVTRGDGCAIRGKTKGRFV